MVEVLLADDALAELVGDRVFPVVVRLETALPCVIYRRLAGDREYVMTGPAGWASVVLSLMVWGREYGEARAGADALRRVLDGYCDDAGDDEEASSLLGSIELASVQDAEDDYAEELDAFGCGVTVTVQWAET